MSAWSNSASGLCPSHPNLPRVKTRAVRAAFRGTSLQCHVSSGCCKPPVTGPPRKTTRQRKLCCRWNSRLKAWPRKIVSRFLNILISCNVWLLHVGVTQLLLVKQQSSNRWCSCVLCRNWHLFCKNAFSIQTLSFFKLFDCVQIETCFVLSPTKP